MAIPAAAFAAQWMLMVVLTVVEGRGSRKLKGLEAAKRSMIKELKVSLDKRPLISHVW